MHSPSVSVVLSTPRLSLGVSLPMTRWLEPDGLILTALLPFAALGVLLRSLLTTDSVGPAADGLLSLLAVVSGAWFPLGDGVVHAGGEFLPSYRLRQSSHASLGGQAWAATSWGVIAPWTALLSGAARFAYRRDTERA